MEDLGAAITGAGERLRELADRLTESILQLLREYQAYKPGPLGPYKPALSGEIYSRVAGALAAVRLEEARRWMGNMHSHEKPWPGCDHCAYLVALERAVEGK